MDVEQGQCLYFSALGPQCYNSRSTPIFKEGCGKNMKV